MKINIVSYILAIIVLIISFCIWIDSELCSYRFLDNGILSKYTLNGCMVYDNNQWVTEEEFL